MLFIMLQNILAEKYAMTEEWFSLGRLLRFDVKRRLHYHARSFLPEQRALLVKCHTNASTLDDDARRVIFESRPLGEKAFKVTAFVSRHKKPGTDIIRCTI